MSDNSDKEKLARPTEISSVIYHRFRSKVRKVYSDDRLEGALRTEIEYALEKHGRALDKRIEKINKHNQKAD